MQLVYYRNQEGKITSHHNVPKDWTPEYLKEQIEKYNSTNSPSHKAFLVEVEDGSFEQYLLDSLHRKYRLPPPTLSRPPKTPWARRWTALRVWR